MDYIEVRTRYPKIAADGGKPKLTNEKYIAYAPTRCNAEAMVLNEIRHYIENNRIADMTSRIMHDMHGVLFNHDGGKYYLAKVKTFDNSPSGKDVRSDVVYLIQATNFELAHDRLKALLSKCKSFWEIEQIIETKIKGVIMPEYE